MWIIASDLYINTDWLSDNQFLNEIPIANYLDEVMQEEDSPVTGYFFTTSIIDLFLSSFDDTKIKDFSTQHVYTMNLQGAPENLRDLTYDQFYIPVEVNGQPGINRMTGEKLDAFEALYDYVPANPPTSELDPK